MKLDEKVALVTGAGTGVGAATAVLLAKKGCRVAVNYRRSGQEAAKVVTSIEDVGGEVFAGGWSPTSVCYTNQESCVLWMRRARSAQA